MNLKSKKGFTLVELIIVIAILGIIALIAVPSLTGVQKRSQVNADIRTAEQIGKSVRVWLTDANINQTRQREAYIEGTNYVELAAMAKDKVTDTPGATDDNGMEDYISLTYAPNVTNEDGDVLKFWIGLVNDKVVVAVAEAAPTRASYTEKYELDTDSKVVEGIAYVEGVSNLTTETISSALDIEVE